MAIEDRRASRLTAVARNTRGIVGAEPYFYMVSYDKNAHRALAELRKREFAAGRFFPQVTQVEFSLDELAPANRAQTSRFLSIAQAQRAAGAQGTRSILDVDQVGDQPDVGVTYRLEDDELLDIFGSTRPTRNSVVENLHVLLATLERGECCYFSLWENEHPDKLLFVGYSYD